MSHSISRRDFLSAGALLTGGLLLPSWANALAPAKKKLTYKVAVVDLMILKRQKLGALQLTKDIGADGVEVDMGGLGQRETFDNQLAKPEIRQQFIDKAKELNLEICSLAMTGFYAQSFATRPTYQRMIQDCLDTMKALNVKVAFLPLGTQGDLRKNPELRPAIVERLKVVGEMARKAGVIVGIETALDAKGEVELLKEIGSKNIQIYFNFSNPLKEGRDLYAELKTLGRKRICQMHATDEDGVWLQNNTRLDMNKVKQTLADMGWEGWLVIERSRDATDPRNVKKNFGANAAYLKSVFQS
ncbi:sugar phosphate isomerase/epimerase [Hymenobacter sp. 5317J-9]|uniref:sugar phosphate isomerase/epimerase family protein n=1 Tax=Hymenobacter sp. 5317J-9 TaxID=2932250 RepID=UPI001FD6D01D|nr:sugar phosphate isomerase/epimerase family protein [Hymenobacter sp. 5317J-9]UOQ96766.1 sugar phosphate isomerase/epimerase [Hymenobacter sp. 5317J-9]